MAAADPPYAFRYAAKRAIHLNCLDEVLTTCGRESAIIPKEWANGDLIKPNHGNQRFRWELQYRLDGAQFRLRASFLATRLES